MGSQEKNLPDEQVLQEINLEQEQQLEETTSKITDTTDQRDARITELQGALDEAQKRERNNLLRAKAEIENVRRRSKQDIEKAHKFSLEHFVKELLPVIDNLERALAMSDKKNTELAPTIEGIELTLKSLLNTVHKFGVNILSDTKIPFNPELHQAMTMLESDEIEPNQVMMVIQKGYILNGRLLRPAMVAVSKAKV